VNTKQFLRERNVVFEVLEHSPTYGAQRLAQAVDVPGREVAKTVLLRADHGDSYVVAVLPATHSIDFAKARQLLASKSVELATEIEMSEHCPDCEFGVLPPFGSQYGMRTVVDEALARDEVIVFESNNHHEAIRLEFSDFRDLERPVVGSFAVGP